MSAKSKMIFIPSLEKLETKIEDIVNSDRPYLVEGIVLQTPSINAVTTRNGENVSLAETILGDDTAEISLLGWRNLSSLVTELKVGERIKIRGVVTEARQRRETSTFLETLL